MADVEPDQLTAGSGGFDRILARFNQTEDEVAVAPTLGPTSGPSAGSLGFSAGLGATSVEQGEAGQVDRPTGEHDPQKLVVHCPNRKMDDGAAAAAPPPAKRGRRSRSPCSRPHREPGCHWTGKLSLRDKHVADDCEFTAVTCSLEGCKASVARRGLAEHEASCECRPVPCEHCGSSFVQRGLKAHVRTCDAVEIDCPQKCGERFSRGKKGEHAGSCPLVKLPCPFAQHGCKCEPLRRDFDKHQSEAATEHSMLMNAKVAALSSGLAALEGKVASLEHSNRVQARATVANSGYAEGTLRWNITGMAAKIAAKERVSSVGYGVVGPVKGAGIYHMSLRIDICGTHMGVYVMHHESGCCKMPVRLGGTRIELIGQATMSQTYVEGSNLETAGFGRGFVQFLTLQELQRDYVHTDDTIEIVAKVRIAHGPSVQTIL